MVYEFLLKLKIVFVVLKMLSLVLMLLSWLQLESLLNRLRKKLLSLAAILVSELLQSLVVFLVKSRALSCDKVAR